MPISNESSGGVQKNPHHTQRRHCRSLRPRPAKRGRPSLSEGSLILYQIGSTIRSRDKLELEDILLLFHANEEIQQMCRTALANVQAYLVLQRQEGKGEHYVAQTGIPEGG